MPMSSHPNFPYFSCEQDSQNIICITPNTSLESTPNYLEYLESLIAILLHYSQQADIKGIISCNNIHQVEIDYKMLYEIAKHVDSFEQRLRSLASQISTLRKLRKPFVALIQGRHLDTSLPPMLWASYRIATEDTRIGLVESKYGLFPGFSTTVLMSRLLGSESAISLLTQSSILSAKDAQTVGLLDEMAADTSTALAGARQWILHQSSSARIERQLAFDEHAFDLASSAIRSKTRDLIPGVSSCLEIIKASQQFSLEEALQYEAKLYTAVWNSKEAVSMIRTHYYGIRDAQQSSGTSSSVTYKLQRLGVLGAGMMGSGIAYEAARVGVAVVLKDVSLAAATSGKNYSEKLTAKLVQQGRMSEEVRQQLLDHISPTDVMSDLENTDLIIEAVFEDQGLKAEVTLESLPYLNASGFFASNTTSLPITTLASITTRPENFIGMHFFSPVDRMPLVEIILGKQSDANTLEKALQVVHQLGKIPIVVNDGPAFFTSRIFFNYLLEAITMLLEGIPASLIEQGAHRAGFAVGPLAVLDEISLALMTHVYDQFPRLHSSQQRCYNYLKRLMDMGRNGTKAGHGLYDYDTLTGKKTIWLDEALPILNAPPSLASIQKRLLHVMALDSYRCLEEGVLVRPIDGDIGSILGIGYAPHTGGVFGHIDQVGLPNFVKECQAFALLGEQWTVPSSLISLAERDYRFYSAFYSNWPPA